MANFAWIWSTIIDEHVFEKEIEFGYLQSGCITDVCHVSASPISSPQKHKVNIVFQNILQSKELKKKIC